MAKKTNWNKIQNQKAEDDARYRDVYEDQQLDRSHIEEKQTMTSRALMVLALSLVVFALVYWIVALVEMTGVCDGINAAWNKKFYDASKIESNYQYVTIRTQVPVLKYEKIQYDEEGNVVTENQFTKYIYNKTSGVLINITDRKMPSYITPETKEDIETEQVYSRIYQKLDINEEYYLGTVDGYGDVYTDAALHTYIDYDNEYGNADDIEIENGIQDNVYLANYGFVLDQNAYRYVILDHKMQPVDTADKLFHKRLLDLRPTPIKLVFSFIVAMGVFAIMYMVAKKNLDAQNIMSDTSDINQYHNDQHIALPEEVQTMYDIFPDVGAHSNVMVSSMISHMMITNKGLKKIALAKRADKDIKDEDGDIITYKGDILRDENGEPITTMVPMIDNSFSEALFDSSKVPKEKYARKYYNATDIPYNPGNANLDKLKDYDTVDALINKDWTFPVYEPQRPGGIYIVDTAPVNTMVLAITRAGKGQTIIEPTIDMWTRENRPNNMVINDPKGELLVKNYVRGTVRGFTIVQFNLINPMKTDIYNPLALAADAARDGNSTKCAMYVENIAEVFFPVDGGEDPVWPNAANNAFKRAAYGLIDYYLEEEKEMRRLAAVKNIDRKVLELKIDEMWGKVTLYNCYQLFVQMSSKKQQPPTTLAKEKADEIAHGRDYTELSAEEQAEIERLSEEALEREPVWDHQKEPDLLTLYFNATDMLPKNSMRTLVSNANNALKAMGGAEKMMASVYGIAITAMAFFTDPTISTLTSGTLSQNVDLAGLSFPRRFGVRFHMDYLKSQHFVGMQCIWESFKDPEFKENMGKDFYHEDTVSREGWARYFFKGIYSGEKAWVRLQIKDTGSGMLVKTFYFEFQKDYKTSYDGRTYMKDPVLDEKIVQDGFLTEMVKVKKSDGTIVFKKRPSTFDKDTITNLLEVAEAIADVTDETEKQKIRDEKIQRENVKTNTIISMSSKYQEKCKMVFLVTPPHLMKYAKLILILIKQLVDLNFDQSYMTKSNQKPLYKTRYMLDELGNLQSEGHGISGFETMLSIGLGQEQQFTLILQTLQQLKDVYGDSVDKIVQGNTSNIIFLKSTDNTMIETLSQMSGVRHKTYTDGKSVTRDVAAMTSFSKNEAKVTYNMSTKEEPVISYNDMASIPPCNSIVFRAGDSPIWNRNETALPMSWRLFKNTITNPGKEYSLQTIPTLSTAKDFDVKQNQPNFSKMFDKRLAQAAKAQKAMQYYKDVYGLTDDQIQKLDIDVYSDDIMEIISTMLHPDVDMTKREENPDAEETLKQVDVEPSDVTQKAQENNEIQQVMMTDPKIQRAKTGDKKIYANRQLSRNDIYNEYAGGANHQYDASISAIYIKLRNRFAQDTRYFSVDQATNNLVAVNTGEVYIYGRNNGQTADQINEAAKDPNSRVYSEGDVPENYRVDLEVTDAFYKFLATFDTDWDFAQGEFSRHMAVAIQNGNAA